MRQKQKTLALLRADDGKRSVLSSAVAAITCSVLMLPTGLTYAYADDQPNGTASGEGVVPEAGYPSASEQLSSNLDEGIVDVEKDDGIFAGVRSLLGMSDTVDMQPTGKNILVKHTYVDRAQTGDTPTLDSIYEGIPDGTPNSRIIMQEVSYSTIYDVGDADYYVSFIDSGVLNGTGTPTDISVANNNDNGEVLDGCEYDTGNGIIYIPKSIIDGYVEEAELPIQAQLIVPMELGDLESKHVVDVSVTGDGLFASTKSAGIEVNTYDNQVTIPIANADIAGNIALSDISIAINGGDYQQLTEDENSVTAYDPTTGALILATSAPASINTIDVKISNEAYTTRAFADKFDPNAITNALPGVKYTGLDTSTLEVGDFFYYDGNVVAIRGISQSSSWVDEIKNTAKYVYVPQHSDTGQYAGGHSAYDNIVYRAIANGSSLNLSGDGWTYGALDSIYDTGVVAALTLPGQTGNVHAQFGAAEQDWSAEGLESVSGETEWLYIAGSCVANNVANSTVAMGGHQINNNDGAQCACTLGARILHIYDDDSILLGVISPAINPEPGQATYSMVRVKVEASSYIDLQKASDNTDVTKDNPNYSLQGAVYGIYSDKGCTDQVGTLTTDAKGYAAPAKVKARIPYYVKELTPSKGYALDDTVYTIKAMEPNETARVNGTVVADASQAGPTGDVPETPQTKIPPDMQKLDRQSMTNIFEGGSKLEGAEFTLRFYYSEAQAGQSPKRTWVVRTAENGYAELSEDYLVASESDELYYDSDGNPTIPLGYLTVQETAAPEGYHLNSETHKYSITYDGVLAADGESVLVKPADAETDDQVYRGDYMLVKIDESQQQLGNIPFLLTNDKSGESHIVVTDENGYIDTSSDWNAHSANTNANDKAITINSGEVVVHLSPDVLTEDYEIDADALDSTAGVWFSGYGNYNDPEHEAASKVAVNDDMGALPYGEYTLTELRCEANEGLALIERHFTVIRDNYKIDGGTATDSETEIELSTTATDHATGEPYGDATASETVTIDDVVSYKGVTPNMKYTLEGQLYDANTGKAITDAEGNAITASVDFTSDRESGEVRVPFNDIPAELVAGKTIVVFETLYYKGSPVAVHQDLDDTNQWVSYPSIGTDATDATTGTHEGYAGAEGETVVIEDVVDYFGLRPGTEYTVNGVLMDKDTGESLKDASGNEITATTTFTPETMDGSVTLTFNVPGGLLAGKTVVAFENVYEGERHVAAHEDINDEQQTVYYPAIGTQASDAADGDQVFSGSAQVVLNDVVSYENLEAGAEYEMVGTLMDKATGQPVVDASGAPITVSQKFVPEAEDGQMTMSFAFDVTAYVGHEIVVFEDLNKNGNLVAKHADINDAAQTVLVRDAGLADDLINDQAALAQTGDGAAVAAGALAVVAAAVAAGVVANRRRASRG